MSDWMQTAVRFFHKAMNLPAPNRVDTDGVRTELRARLILEEALETAEALGYQVHAVTHRGYHVRRGELIRLELVKVQDPDWPEVLDGLCDLLYVTFGCAVEMGVGLGPFFHEVHRSNMTKVGGETREDGKILKPEGYEPPRLVHLWNLALNRGHGIDMPSDGYP